MPNATTRALRTLTLATAGWLLAGSALAQPAAQAQQACAPDIQTYCAGVQQGEGRIAKCLEANSQKLSPACKAGMAKTGELMKEVVEACRDDLHQFCAGAAQGTVKSCLQANFRQLSFGCKRELFEAKKGG